MKKGLGIPQVVEIGSYSSVTGKAAPPFVIIYKRSYKMAQTEEEAKQIAKKSSKGFNCIIRTKDYMVFNQTMTACADASEFYNHWKNFGKACDDYHEMKQLHDLKKKFPQFFNSKKLPKLNPVMSKDWIMKPFIELELKEI